MWLRHVVAANTRMVPSPQATTTLLPSMLNDAVLGDEQAEIEFSGLLSCAFHTVTSPLADAKWVSVIQSRRASAFMCRTNVGSDPSAAIANATAASFALASSSP